MFRKTFTSSSHKINSSFVDSILKIQNMKHFEKATNIAVLYVKQSLFLSIYTIKHSIS